ncbi:hypothetical protein HanIR_Chr09g0448531 [Helianthus annuus]|nr:hypothetical protein HanIR_Chr09g0448531 [Helianthus annuus]
MITLFSVDQRVKFNILNCKLPDLAETFCKKKNSSTLSDALLSHKKVYGLGFCQKIQKKFKKIQRNSKNSKKNSKKFKKIQKIKKIKKKFKRTLRLQAIIRKLKKLRKSMCNSSKTELNCTKTGKIKTLTMWEPTVCIFGTFLCSEITFI